MFSSLALSQCDTGWQKPTFYNGRKWLVSMHLLQYVETAVVCILCIFDFAHRPPPTTLFPGLHPQPCSQASTHNLVLRPTPTALFPGHNLVPMQVSTHNLVPRPTPMALFPDLHLQPCSLAPPMALFQGIYPQPRSQVSTHGHNPRPPPTALFTGLRPQSQSQTSTHGLVPRPPPTVSLPGLH